MTINYTTLLGLAKPVTGTETGQWGDIVNDEITSLLEDSIAKSVTLNVTSGNVTLTTTSGASNQARVATLIITGTPGTTRNIIAQSQDKIYQVINQSNSSVVIKGSATTGVTILSGASGVVVWNGSDFIEIGAIASNRTINGTLQVAAGGAAAPSISPTGDSNTGVYFPAENTVGIATGGMQRVVVDSEGNVLVGTLQVASGSAAAPSISANGDSNTGVYFPAADTVAISTGGTQRVVVDSAGNVGVGTSSPSSFGGYTTVSVNNAVNGGIYNILVNGTETARMQAFAGIFNLAAKGAATNLTFETNNTERARIDSSGNFLVGYTSSNGAYKLQVNSQIFATSSTIATSDGRYKKDIQSLDGALGLVNQLNPVQFSWKEHQVHAFDTLTPTIGFIAQEVQQVLADKPYLASIVKTNICVIEPEEKDENGHVTKEAVTEEFLGIAEGNLIALLTKSIQEQQAIIQTLSDRITALEAK